MTDDKKIVAVGFLTEKEFRTLGQDLKHVYPLPSDGKFEDLLRRLDRKSRMRS